MLDTATKRRIDTARDILVGKVPDPKSQVEQITIALIYKFMDDMDAEAEELGGKRSFFAGDFARYGWAKLMRSGLGGHETLNLYAEAISRMPENPGVPALFRDIFKNAFLPYRDPETLRAFLKIIDEFDYDHSERLGDAFEYLLSVLGSQGDAGQFRTPRHIIDFIVAIVDPKKHETILDPACGTAGFLISAWKHVQAANRDANGESSLTPDQQETLAGNVKGYDISPDMVRLSLANMYLHGFIDPHIAEYDTLTSDDRWNEFADVILANPPFMSPKGGIRPHNRFSVQSNRSEVLFVDYIAEHLTPNGRAGIIVPEGVIFQSGKSYKALRKMLVEKYLVAVVSLPAGVFNPYSGVKTSILILDRAGARVSDTIGFFKVANDGFSLGAQRRETGGSELAEILAEIADYRAHMGDEGWEGHFGRAVAKAEIGKTSDYNLNGDRYGGRSDNASSWPIVSFGEAFDKVGDTVEPNQLVGPVNYVGLENISQGTGNLVGDVRVADPAEIKSLKNVFRAGDILYGKLRPNLNKVWLADRDGICSTDIFVLRPHDETTLAPLFSYLVRSRRFNDTVIRELRGAQLPRVSWSSFEQFEIPLPPLEVQREIAAEIEGYQKVINGARAVVENYRPHIAIDSEWPIVSLAEACEINPETLVPEKAFPGQTVHYIDISSVENGTGRLLGSTELEASEAPSRARRGVRTGDVLLSTVRPNLKAFALLGELSDRSVASTGFAVLRAKPIALIPGYLHVVVRSDAAVEQMVSMMEKGAYPSINQSDLAQIRFALPPLEFQREIVAELETVRALVEANRELIGRMEKKVEAAVARVWGSTETSAPQDQSAATEATPELAL